MLTDRGRSYDDTCDRPGCSSRLAWEFTGAGKGSTTLVFRYCYRSNPDNCQPGPAPPRGPAEPARVTVTVG